MNKLAAYIILLFIVFGCNNYTPKFDIKNFPKEQPSPGDIIEHSGISFENKDYTEAFELIDYWLEAQKDYEQIAGLTAIITDDNETKWIGSFGTSDGVNQMRKDNRFSICSISKLFTSVAIMQLVDAGKISIDDPIKKHLPWFNISNSFGNSNAITIKSILTHSSGLPRESNHPYWSGPEFPFPSKQDVINELGNQKLLYPPSKYYQYSNLGLSLLGYVVEAVSGVPYSEYINNEILIPLSMVDTKTFMSKDDYGNSLSIGFSSLMRNGKREKVNFFNANGIEAAAGFTSTVDDIAKFARWQMKLYDGSEKDILMPETIKEMHKIYWFDNVKYGLGFRILDFDDETWVGHGGSCPGYRSQLFINPDKKIAYSVMINSSGTSPTKYIKGIHEILSKVNTLKGTEINKFKDLTGSYNTQPWTGETYVQSWGDHIALVSLPSDEPYLFRLYRNVDNDLFKRVVDNDKLGEELEILRDNDNTVIGYKTHQNIYKRSR